MLILFIFHAISGLGRTEVSFIVSVIWTSTLLTSGSLQQNVIDVATTSGQDNWQHVCMQIYSILNTFMSSSWEHKRIMHK